METTRELSAKGRDHLNIEAPRPSKLFVDGDALRRIRTAQDLTQEGLARGAGVTTRTLTDMERLDRPFSAQTVALVAKRLEIPERKILRFPSTVPVAATELVGRVRERELVVDGICRHRLVTVAGPPGCGKSRVAGAGADAARNRFWYGARWFSALAHGSLGSLFRAMSESVGTDRPPRSEDQLFRLLRNQSILIVLDDVDHLATEVAGFIDRLLASTRFPAVVATACEPLALVHEHVARIAPMDTERDLDVEGHPHSEAGALFIAHLRRSATDLVLTPDDRDAIETICARLDGLPTAIELAAARVEAFTPRALLGQLDEGLGFLSTQRPGAPPHHASLVALLDWSVERIDPAQQSLLRRLSLLPGTWTLEAAKAVIGPPDGSDDPVRMLGDLVDKSLIVSAPRSGRQRYRMLRTIRSYAHERLRPDERETVRSRLLTYYSELSRAASQGLRGPDLGRWLDRLDDERGTLEHALRAPGDDALVITIDLTGYWLMRGAAPTGEALLSRQIDGVSPSGRLELDARRCLGNLIRAQGRLAEAAEHYERSRVIAAEIGDELGVARALGSLGHCALGDDDLDCARELFEDACRAFEALTDVRGMSLVQMSLGNVAERASQFDEAEEHYDESLRLHRESGDEHGAADALGYLGNVMRWRERNHAAKGFLKRSLGIFERLGQSSALATTHAHLARVAIALEDPDGAREHLVTALDRFSERRHARSAPEILDGAAELAAWADAPDKAVQLSFASEAIREITSDRRIAIEQRRVEAFRRRLAKRVGPRFAELRAMGSRLAPDEALEIAEIMVVRESPRDVG